MIEKIISLIMSVYLLFFPYSPALFGGQNINDNVVSKILPDTWAAVDGLGRTLSSDNDVEEYDNTKFVGMFYWTWHTNFGTSLTAQNATEYLKKYPDILYDFNNPLWDPTPSYPDGRPYFWNEPIWGYYLDTDEYVLRKNAELLADAGVDVIFFDCTNGTSTWDESALKLFEVFEKAKNDGVNVPKVAYMLPFADNDDSTTSLKHLYKDIYSIDKYKDLWFYWDGKPMIMAHSSQLNKNDETEKAILDFFTFRENEPTYFADSTRYSEKTWGWCSDYPQAKYGKSVFGRVEEMCVSVAQNAADGKLSAQNADANVQGRSFTKGNYSYSYDYAGNTIKVDKNIENSEFYGLNFQQQWDYAIECDPDMIFVDGWNEWIAGRWEEWCGTPNAFPDQFNDEHSRDIEPSNGELKDYYYYQLVENIRRFKGISNRTITTENGKEYYHYSNSTYNRNSAGWVGEYYTNNTMRNDFVKATVSDANGYVTLKIETKDDVTPYTDNAWMRILLDTDPSGKSTNWEGFEYIINRNGATQNQLKIEKFVDGWKTQEVGKATYSVFGNIMTVTFKVSDICITDKVSFNFKLSDNMQNDGDILDFYTNGDVAPGGRFTFVY